MAGWLCGKAGLTGNGYLSWHSTNKHCHAGEITNDESSLKFRFPMACISYHISVWPQDANRTHPPYGTPNRSGIRLLGDRPCRFISCFHRLHSFSEKMIISRDTFLMGTHHSLESKTIVTDTVSYEIRHQSTAT